MDTFNCLYDCGSNSPSTQEYHIYPASASTVNLRLAPGAVCDACNAYFSKLEGYFASHHPGASMRVWDGVVTRKGKTPKFTHENGEMTRVDGEDARHITTQLGDLQFQKHPNGDVTIIGKYRPRPYDASKISRVLHKIAFEILCGYSENQNLHPMHPRFAALRDYVRRPKNSNDFRPFAWKRRQGAQEVPVFVTVRDPDNEEIIAEICEVRFPGMAYLVVYPPWPTSSRIWDSVAEANTDVHIVSSPGMTSLEPESIRIPLILQCSADQTDLAE